jgi:hypothetical protein
MAKKAKVVKPTKAEQKKIDARLAKKYPKKAKAKEQTLYEQVKSGKKTSGKPSAHYIRKGK